MSTGPYACLQLSASRRSASPVYRGPLRARAVRPRPRLQAGDPSLSLAPCSSRGRLQPMSVARSVLRLRPLCARPGRSPPTIWGHGRKCADAMDKRRKQGGNVRWLGIAAKPHPPFRCSSLSPTTLLLGEIVLGKPSLKEHRCPTLKISCSYGHAPRLYIRTPGTAQMRNGRAAVFI